MNKAKIITLRPRYKFLKTLLKYLKFLTVLKIKSELKILQNFKTNISNKF